MRKEPLIKGEIYHIFNRSIAGFVIFNNKVNIKRMIDLIVYYQMNPSLKFSDFTLKGPGKTEESAAKINTELVSILAYCIMPTHFHLILQQAKDNGISIFMSNVLNAYSRYFNVKHNRKGPLWEGRFKNRLIKSDEDALHLTRYIHLNPVTAKLVEQPHLWEASSYNEYIDTQKHERFCSYKDILDINPLEYKKFVEDRISYQQALAVIKDLLLE